MNLQQKLNEIVEYCKEQNIFMGVADKKYPVDESYLVDALTDSAKEPLVLGKYELVFIDGYTGHEDGGSYINFLCRINDDFFVVTGSYSSWDGSDFNLHSSFVINKPLIESKTIEYERVLYKAQDGKIIWSKDVEIERDKDPDSWG